MDETEGNDDASRFYALFCVHIWMITMKDNRNYFKNVLTYLVSEYKYQYILRIDRWYQY